MSQKMYQPIQGNVYCIGAYGTAVFEKLRNLELRGMSCESVLPTCDAIALRTDVVDLPKVFEGREPELRIAMRECKAMFDLVRKDVTGKVIVIVADLSEEVTHISSALLAGSSRGPAAIVALLSGTGAEFESASRTKAIERLKQHADLLITLDEPTVDVEKGSTENGLVMGAPEAQETLLRIIEAIRTFNAQ